MVTVFGVDQQLHVGGVAAQDRRVSRPFDRPQAHPIEVGRGHPGRLHPGLFAAHLDGGRPGHAEDDAVGDIEIGLLACILVASSGMLLGYLAARAAGLGSGQRRAVSLETGVQNAPLAIAVILATFPETDQDALLKLPFLYAMTALCVGTLATMLYRRFPSA